MKKLLLLLIVLFIITLVFSQNATEIAKSCLPSTVFITMEDQHHQPLAIGSGFIVGEGKIITNLHVIEGAKFGYVLLIDDDTKHNINGYFKIDEINDLALLSVPTISGKVLPLFNGDYPEIGERIYAIGNPKGLSGTISEGIVSGLRSDGENKLIQITAPISPGSSGGPVINNEGEVVGVAVGTITSGQNLNFAIPSSLVKALLENQANTATMLDIYEGTISTKTSKDELDIKEGIEIQDLETKVGYISDVGQFLMLGSMSIRNMLPHFVYNIQIIFILYDKSGLPVDYLERTFFDSSDGIRPFLARTIIFDQYYAWEHRALRKKGRNSGENLEIRILDFTILE